MKIIPNLVPVDSTNLAAVGHDSKSTLYLRFKKGDVYSYTGVTFKTFLEMLMAESVGKYFHAHIKALPYEKIEGAVEQDADDLSVGIQITGGELQRGTPYSAGYDLTADTDGRDVKIEAFQHKLIGTGITLAMPPTVCALVTPRSGLALKFGITVLNGPGLIDPDYRGEVGVVLHNTSNQTFTVSHGTRIAQLLFLPFLTPAFQKVKSLTETTRGIGGFGSTGH
jgi:dUTP pyrophosphatase